mgnify:CR=1 FL=1
MKLFERFEGGFMRRYSNGIRTRASELFESGFGYKATATILGLPMATVRDWKRLWVKGKFVVHRPSIPEALREVMLENNVQFVWAKSESLLTEAYRRSIGRFASPRYTVHCVLNSVKSSDLFIKVPIYIRTSNANEHPVYKLVDRVDFELI